MAYREILPNNSHKASREAPAEREKLDKVATGRIRPEGKTKRLREAFFGDGSTESLAEYVVFSILVPAARDTIMDVGHGIVDQIFGGRGHGRSLARNAVGNVLTNYNAASRTTRGFSSSRPSRQDSARDFAEVVFDSRLEAEDVLDQLLQQAERYDYATLDELYDLVGVDAEYTDRKWGWSVADLRNSSARKVRDGYILDIVRPRPIDGR